MKKYYNNFVYEEVNQHEGEDEDSADVPILRETHQAKVLLGDEEDICNTEVKPANLIFQNISLLVGEKRWFGGYKKESVVLRGVSGSAKSGQVLAILGASGAGKTSLLNVLAGRIYEGNIYGDITVDFDDFKVSSTQDPNIIKKVGGYVTQEDHLLPNLTVWETLHYYAELRLPHLSAFERTKQVEMSIKELRLWDCINSKIGSNEFDKQISGGQRRRVSIAIQLITNPSILFLDEPTSGLDSTTAHYTVKTLLKLARKGRTVICSIHQPRSDIFDMFDQVMLLSKGEVAYFGKADEMVTHFSSLGHSCPKFMNPADFAMDLICGKSADSGVVDMKKIIAKGREMSVADVSAVEEVQDAPYVEDSSSPHMLKTIQIITRRSLTNLRRDRQNLMARVFNLAGMGILLMCFIWKLSLDQSSIQNRIGVIYQTLSAAAFVGSLNAIAMFPFERDTFIRDERDGAYSTFSFWMSNTLIHFVFNLFSAALASVFVYFGNSLVFTWDKFLMFIFVAFMVQFWGETLGCIICTFFKDVNIANSWGTILLTFYMITAGFFRSAKGFPLPFKIINYLSPMRYGGSILAANEMENLHFHCSTAQRLPNGNCPVETGKDVLDRLDIDMDDINMYLIGLGVIIFGLRCILFFTLRFSLPKPKQFTALNLSLLKEETQSVRIVDEEERQFVVQENVQRLSIRFENLNVTINTKMGWRKSASLHILKGVSGDAQPGELLAILGTSGSGKTTLLNVLAGRLQIGDIQGSIYLNNSLVNCNHGTSNLKDITGYVMQDDVLLPHLTVRETLTFAALLKLPSSVSRTEKLYHVDSVMAELGLSHCADSKIGGEFVRGISGGEKRRVSIGIQLLTNPSLLFLDEPTSGLDSSTANQIMETLLKLAKRGRTVICTIHQPRSSIFSLFDKIMLMSKGQVAYFGPSNEMVKFFSEIGYDCPFYCNPADFAMDLVTVDNKNKIREQATRKRLASVVSAYQNRAYHSHNSFHEIVEEQESIAKQRSIPSLYAFFLLLERNVFNMVRDKPVMITKLLSNILLGLLLGGVSYHLKSDQAGAYDRQGSLNLLLSVTPFITILASIVKWHSEQLVYVREKRDGMYSTFPYYFAKIFCEYPVDAFFTLIFWCITYYMIGFNHQVDKFFISFGVVLLLLFNSQYFGYTFSALFPNLASANLVANVFYTIFYLTAGWVVNYKDIVIAFRWIKDISFIKYGYEAFCINEFKGLKFYCTPEEASQTGGFCPITTGEQMLELLSMQHVSLQSCIMILGGILVFFNLTFLFFIHRKK